MNFTWFASSYDTDDVPYRLLTMVQMAGVLVLAAGVPAAFDDGDYRAVTLGYLIMRIGLVAQWLRAGDRGPGEPRARRCRYATGITIVAGGLGAAPRPRARPACCPSRSLRADLRRASSSWSSRCRCGRSGRGRPAGTRTTSPSATACSRSSCSARACSPRRPGCEGALDAGGVSGCLRRRSRSPGSCCCSRSGGCTSSSRPARASPRRRDRSYLWGYGHYGIFAALAALGAGLEVAVEQTGHHLEVSRGRGRLRRRDPGRRLPRPAVGGARADRAAAGHPARGDSDGGARRPAPADDGRLGRARRRSWPRSRCPWRPSSW